MNNERINMDKKEIIIVIELMVIFVLIGVILSGLVSVKDKEEPVVKKDTIIIKANIGTKVYYEKDGRNIILYNIESLKYNDKEYKYLTIHSAKGLEEDFVILLNVSNSTYGLPNKIENHNILSYVSSKEDDYPFAEERRVFFVAITRCKFKTYLMVPKNNPSIFIEEIKKVI